MNRYLNKIAVAVVFSVACLVFSVNAGAGQYLLFKGLNVTQSCLDGLIQVPDDGLVPAPPVLLSCSKFAYQDTETLAWDEATASCESYEDFTAANYNDIQDAFIQYGGAQGTLSGILESIFLADGNALVRFDSVTGEVIRGESTVCAEGDPPPPPPPPEVITKGAFLKASNTYFNARFGESLAFSGNTVVVGAPMENSDSTGINGDDTIGGADQSGAVYVFVYSAGVWSQQAYIKASNTGFGDQFGSSVAISGDTLVVGAWQEDSNATGVNGNEADNSRNGAGAVYVFVRNGEIWTQQAYLKASNTYTSDFFGTSVAIDGDSLVVGAFGEDSNATGVNGDQSDDSITLSGAAYVFVRNDETWGQQAYLKAPYPGIQYLFGASVAISGDTVAIGSHEEKSDATGVDGPGGDNELADDSGAAFVFNRVGENWSQQAYLKASNTGASDQFGKSVSISGDTIVVGAWYEDSNAIGVNGNEADNSISNAGAVYVFARNGEIWTQQAYLKASNTSQLDQFGNSVAISGNMIVVGALEERSDATGINGDEDNDLVTHAGAAYAFERDAGVWSQRAYLKATNTGQFDEFGFSTSVSDGVFVVGAHGERSDSTGVDGPDNDLMVNSGAAYVIVLPEDIVVHLPPEPLRPGSVFTVTAIGFKPGTSVQAFLQSEPVLVGEEMADTQGEVTFEITIPLDFPPGDHSLILLGLNPDDSERRLTAPLSILSTGTIFLDGFE